MATELINEPNLVAYSLHPDTTMKLVTASSSRAWMQETSNRFANRCLPLLIANQAGWFILNNRRFHVTWNGNNDVTDLSINYPEGPGYYAAQSHFGHGIVTWNIPYLFRTSPGYSLLVRGPANWPKDGIIPLEGIVETDWSTATFTMNWKLTRSDTQITFEKDEPICMIVPQRRGELERFLPKSCSITTDTEVEQGYENWSKSREAFLAELGTPGTKVADDKDWQKDYFRGRTSNGTQALEHQTKLRLHEFNHE